MTTDTANVKVDLAPLDGVMAAFPDFTEGQLIPLLQKTQGAYRYLPMPVLEEISRRTGVALSRIYGIVTFYSQFYLDRRGEHTIRVCSGTACYVRGAARLIDEARRQLNIEPEETTEDGQFTLESVNCLGACALAPVVVLDGVYHHHITPTKLRKLVQAARDAEKETTDA